MTSDYSGTTNNGQIGTRNFVLHREVVLSSEVKDVVNVCDILFSIVSFIRNVLIRVNIVLMCWGQSSLRGSYKTHMSMDIA